MISTPGSHLTRLFVIVALIGALIAAAGVSARTLSQTSTPPLPDKLPGTLNDCVANNVYYGAVPPGGESSRVLVFVHGLGGRAPDWWTAKSPSDPPNDMYLLAYNAGYRTAFVSLTFDPADCSDVARIPGRSVDQDGATLSAQIDDIRQYYGVNQVDLIGHSKGGVDIQSAIIDHGAASKVRDVFTLSSPHQGSLFAEWCSTIGPEPYHTFCLQDPATQSLRPANMRPVRARWDASPLNAGIRYYYGAGNACRQDNLSACDTSAKSAAIWMLNQPLDPPNSYGGPNDNVVTAAEATLPSYATRLFLESWTHEDVRMGHNSFPLINNILLSERHNVYLPLVLRGNS